MDPKEGPSSTSGKMKDPPAIVVRDETVPLYGDASSSGASAAAATDASSVARKKELEKQQGKEEELKKALEQQREEGVKILALVKQALQALEAVKGLPGCQGAAEVTALSDILGEAKRELQETGSGFYY